MPPRSIAGLASDKGFALDRSQIALNTPIKTIGLHKVPIALHPEVEVSINITVARNADEAERMRLYRELRTIVTGDVPLMFVHYETLNYLMNKNVAGSTITPTLSLHMENVGFTK